MLAVGPTMEVARTGLAIPRPTAWEIRSMAAAPIAVAIVAMGAVIDAEGRRHHISYERPHRDVGGRWPFTTYAGGETAGLICRNKLS